jgi:hypothetical protein
LGTLRLERLDVDGHELREGFPARALFIWWQRSEQLGVCAPNAVESLVRDRLSVVKLPKQRHPGHFAPSLEPRKFREIETLLELETLQSTVTDWVVCLFRTLPH